jgi:hypothetical protein
MIDLDMNDIKIWVDRYHGSQVVHHKNKSPQSGNSMEFNSFQMFQLFSNTGRGGP